MDSRTAHAAEAAILTVMSATNLTTSKLWRNLDGSVVVSTLVPMAGLPGHYDMNHRPADEEDLMMLDFLKPEHENK